MLKAIMPTARIGPRIALVHAWLALSGNNCQPGGTLPVRACRTAPSKSNALTCYPPLSPARFWGGHLPAGARCASQRVIPALAPERDARLKPPVTQDERGGWRTVRPSPEFRRSCSLHKLYVSQQI